MQYVTASKFSLPKIIKKETYRTTRNGSSPPTGLYK